MKKLFSLVLVVTFVLACTPVSFAAVTLAGPGTWASGNTQAGGTVAGAQSGEAIDINGNNLLITNNGAAADTAGSNVTTFNTFNLGALTNGVAAGTGVTTTAIAAATGNLAVTIASVVTNGRAMTVQNTNATAKNTSETVTGTTTLAGGTLTVLNSEATNNQTVGLTLTGNLVSAAAANVTGAAGAGGTGSGSTLTLNGASNTVTTITLDDNVANSRGIATLAVNGAALAANIVGAGAGEGTVTLGSGVTITGNVGTTRIGTLNATAGADTISGNLLTTNLNLGSNLLTLTAGGLTTPAAGTIATTITSATAFGRVVQTAAANSSAATTAAVTVSGYYIPNGATFKLVDGNATGAPTAPTTVTSSSPNVSFAASLTGTDDILLTATRTTTAAAAGNSTTVATAINSAATPTGDFAVALGQLDSLTTTAATDAAYAQLDPIVNAGVNTASFTGTLESIGALNLHLGEVSGGAATGVATGDFWKDNGIWVKGFGSHADQDIRGGIDGYKADLWGVIGGVDGIVADYTRLGFAGGYSMTDVSNKGTQAGGTDLDNIQGTVYLGYDDPSPWYGNAGFSFGWNMYEGTRDIAFGTISRTAKSDYDGQQYTGFGEVGYVWKNMDIEPNQEWNITPMAGLTYSHLALDSYTETNAGDLNLAVESQDYDLLQSSLGLKIDRPWTNENGTFVPEIHVKWLYDFIGDEAATNATFTGGGSSFSTRGADPAQNSINAGAGLTFYSKGNVSLSGTYDFEAKEDYTSHTGQAVLRYTY